MPLGEARRLAVECLEERAVPAGANLAELVSVVTGATSIHEGSTYTSGGTAYAFRLAAAPTAPVTITLVADDARIFTARGAGDSFALSGTGETKYIDFLAAEDDRSTGTVNASVDIVLTSKDPRFNGIFDAISLPVIDNDFLVTSTADSGAGSLRQAIADAQQRNNPTIRFDPSLAGRAIQLSTEPSGLRSAVYKLSIDASALPEGVTIEPAPGITNMRFFQVTNGLELRNLTIRGFNATGDGGAFLVSDFWLRLEDCVLQENQASQGGAIAVLENTRGRKSTVEIVSSVIGSANASLGNVSRSAGGAIYIAESNGSTTSQITIRNSLLANNRAVGQPSGPGAGGAIWNHGDLEIIDSTLIGNRAQTYGGAIGNRGELKISSTTIAQNAASSGGGIDALGGSVHIENSTISGNSATNYGGGLDIGAAPTTIVSSTIVGNSAEVNGGGIRNQHALRTTLRNTIIAGNATKAGGSWVAQDLSGAEFGVSHSLISDPNSALGFGHGTNGNLVGKADGVGGRTLLPLDEILLPLADNGGRTKTHALRPDSPAVDAGEPTTLPFDQRGAGFPRAIGTAVDMGALEFQQNRAPTFLTPSQVYAVTGQFDVYRAAAVDVDLPSQNLVFSLTGGADAGLFNLAADGRLRFHSAPDRNAPHDDNGDSRYELELTVTDESGASARQMVVVTVLGPQPWQNSDWPADVDGDAGVYPMDALMIINELSLRRFSDPETGKLPPISATVGPVYFYDVNGDGYVTAVDALGVINWLHRPVAPESPETVAGEGEGASQALDQLYTELDQLLKSPETKTPIGNAPNPKSPAAEIGWLLSAAQRPTVRSSHVPFDSFAPAKPADEVVVSRAIGTSAFTLDDDEQLPKGEVE